MCDVRGETCTPARAFIVATDSSGGCHVPIEHAHRGNFHHLRCNGDDRGGATA
jgi:hypothetical protein